MAGTLSNFTGDGVNNPLIQLNIALPDTNGGTITVVGVVQATGGSKVNVNGTVTAPAAPGSGSIYFLVEANTTTGALTLLQSTSSMPAVDPGNVLVFSDILTTATTDLAQDPNEVTPDTY